MGTTAHIIKPTLQLNISYSQEARGIVCRFVCKSAQRFSHFRLCNAESRKAVLHFYRNSEALSDPSHTSLVNQREHARIVSESIREVVEAARNRQPVKP